MRETTGDYVITMDDDLQNPPDQALVLIDKAMDGYDVVFGQVRSASRLPGFRRIGSRLISAINRRIFGQPPDLDVSNFRILRRDVVDRICASRTAHPYITGQALMYSSDRANVDVRHEPRSDREEQLQPGPDPDAWCSRSCSATRPTRCGRPRLGGFALSALSFLLGGFYLLRSFFADTRVEGWTTLVVLVSRVQRLHHRAALDDRRVRRPHPQHRRRRRQLPRRREGAATVSDHFVVIGAQRCGTTYLHDLLEAHPDIAMARPARPEPKVFLADEVVERGADWYRRTWFAPRRPARPCSARRAPATSSPPPPRSASARSSATRASSCSCATRSSGRCRTGSSARASGLEDLPLAEAIERNLDRAGRDWDPKRSSVSPYAYLERGRYAEQLVPLAGDVPRAGARPVPRGPRRRPRRDRRSLPAGWAWTRPCAPTTWACPCTCRTSRPTSWARTCARGCGTGTPSTTGSCPRCSAVELPWPAPTPARSTEP